MQIWLIVLYYKEMLIKWNTAPRWSSFRNKKSKSTKRLWQIILLLCAKCFICHRLNSETEPVSPESVSLWLNAENMKWLGLSLPRFFLSSSWIAAQSRSSSERICSPTSSMHICSANTSMKISMDFANCFNSLFNLVNFLLVYMFFLLSRKTTEFASVVFLCLKFIYLF